jgi:carbohydrate kinase (thermoresistant glucokinase family)
MGVAGAGKSLIGSALARALDVDFVEGDDFHSAENVARMSASVPLTDDDRAGWLRLLAARLAAAHRAGRGSSSPARRSSVPIGTSCAQGPDVRFVFLTGDRALLSGALPPAADLFMPPRSSTAIGDLGTSA